MILPAQNIFDKTKKDLDEVVRLLTDDLKTVKTGRAKPSLVEDVSVEAYETRMKLKELAMISAPDFHSLVINPWDKTIIKNIEKAISIAELNLHPIVDADLIRIQIPALTEETRKDLVKLVGQKIESARRMVRQVRNDTKKALENLKGEPNVSEDDLKLWLEEMQKMVDTVMTKFVEMNKAKEQELMTI